MRGYLLLIQDIPFSNLGLFPDIGKGGERHDDFPDGGVEPGFQLGLSGAVVHIILGGKMALLYQFELHIIGQLKPLVGSHQFDGHFLGSIGQDIQDLASHHAHGELQEVVPHLFVKVGLELLVEGLNVVQHPKPTVVLGEGKSAIDGVPGFVWGLLTVLACLLILLGAGIYWVIKNPNAFNFTNTTETSEEESQVSNTDPNKINIPNLVGQRYEDLAAKQSADTGYKIIRAKDDEFNDTYEEGLVVSQSPKTGITAEKGVTIVVTVSKGSRNRELPAISGQSVETAVKALSAQGFIASGFYVESDTVEEGKVIGYENYNAGDLAPYGSKIIITK